MTHLTEDLLHNDEDVIGPCHHEGAQRGEQLTTCERPADILRLDLPTLAGLVGRRLRHAGMPVTAAQSAQYARSLGLTQPGSRNALYWTTRAIFVTGPHQLVTFDRVFEDIFELSR